jgi:hypothetical protein
VDSVGCGGHGHHGGDGASGMASALDVVAVGVLGGGRPVLPLAGGGHGLRRWRGLAWSWWTLVARLMLGSSTAWVALSESAGGYCRGWLGIMTFMIV